MALRILIADDDVEIRTLISFVLRQDPAVVLIGEAVDGDAAIVLASQHRPDIVLMDITMPGVEGLEATRRIKREWPATKVLVLTSLNDDETRCAAFVNGADSFLNIATRLLHAIRDATRAA